MGERPKVTPCQAGQRLDKWLWYVRLVKTRSLAARLIASGKVRVNRRKVTKPAETVRPGDVITAVIHHRLRVYEVLAPGHRRGPADEARKLYRDLTPSDSLVGAKPPQPAPAQRPRGAGRPTKRDRRRLDALRRSERFGE